MTAIGKEHQHHNWSRISVLALSAALISVGCGKLGTPEEGSLNGPSMKDSDGDGTPDACVDDREFLATQAWPEVLSNTCMSCHGPGGPAIQKGATFRLQPAAYPGFLDVNLENIRKIAEQKVGNKSRLLLLPLGQGDHGGGAVLQEDSDAYRVLEKFVQELDDDKDLSESDRVACDAAATASLDELEQLSDVATFRKASLQLNGRLPKESELKKLREDDNALPGLVRGLFKEDAFYERLVEVFNDQWLTDRYLGNGQNLLRRQDFPNVDEYYDGLSDEQREIARRSVAREPLQLMAYIVRNDRPFTEIVTADYTVFNGFTAALYNSDVSFDDSYDENEYKKGKIFIEREQEDGSREHIEWPHAGILSSPMFLNRYPTSRTNVNRHRASTVLREFLATDILKVADRPIDPTSAVTFPNPTSEDPTCQTCHVVLDPIAGAFQKFDDNDQEEYLPNREWHRDMAAPGFGTVVMTNDDTEEGALNWLGRRIAKDPRFPISVVNNIYKSLTGTAPLEFPTNVRDGSYSAWKAQATTMKAISDAFVEDDFNLKSVIEDIVLSPYYRAKNSTATDEGRLAQQGAVGTAQLLTPELLNRKLEAVFGFTWSANNRPALLNDFRILYGGMDSDTVTERLTTPNGVMSAIMWRMANEMSCRAVAQEFAQPKDKRLLFPEVELDTLPVNDLNREDEKGVKAIKKNLAYLYDRMLGEELDPESDEAERVFNLFLDTFHEGNSKLSDDRLSANLVGECQHRRDPKTGEDLPEADRLTQDPRYVIRSWMAVTTYMLSDYRFLYE